MAVTITFSPTSWNRALFDKLTVSQSRSSPLSWNPYVDCYAHKSPPLDPILRQMNPFCILIPYFIKIYFNIILPSMFGYSKYPYPFSLGISW
jgi:hypothetical protein